MRKSLMVRTALIFCFLTPVGSSSLMAQRAKPVAPQKTRQVEGERVIEEREAIAAREYAWKDLGYSEPSKEVIHALRLYGWALPLCVWPSDNSEPSFCVTTAELLQKYPFQSELISTTVAVAADRAYAVAGRFDDDAPPPDQVMDKLLEIGMLLGCNERQSAPVAVTLGTGLTAQLSTPGKVKDVCSALDPDSGSEFGGLTDLVGSASGTRSVSLTEEGQSTYEFYLAQCEAAQRSDPGGGTLSAGGSVEDKEKEAEDAKKKAAAAKAAAAAAKAEAAAAKKKQEDAQRKLEEADEELSKVSADPNSTAADRQKASTDRQNAYDALQAVAAEAAQAQAAADTAQAAADAADQAWRDAERDADYAAGVQAIFDRVTHDDDGVYDPLWPVDAPDMFRGVVRFLGNWWGHYGPDKCLVAECGQTCEEQARVRALVDELYKFKDQECDPAATPLPGASSCYRRGDRNGLPEVSIVAGLKLMCAEIQKVSDRSCNDPMLPRQLEYVFDPCNGPLVMCAPEQGSGFGSSTTIGGNQSVELPSNVRSFSDDAWLKSRTKSSTPGGGGPPHP